MCGRGTTGTFVAVSWEIVIVVIVIVVVGIDVVRVLGALHVDVVCELGRGE